MKQDILEYISILRSENYSMTSFMNSIKEWFKNKSIGTILYFPGHVMLYLWEDKNNFFIIHNSLNINIPQKNKKSIPVRLQSVAITPLQLFSTTLEKSHWEKLSGAINIEKL